MLYFKNDYQEGCAKEILDVLVKTNEVSSVGYGLDIYTAEAINRIKKEISTEDVDIHFLVGGTQTNLTAISVLRPYEAILSPETGHICVHECGAIENTGHKVVSVKSVAGKIDLADLECKIKDHESFHMVKPKMVYISDTTELGTTYTKADLVALRQICDTYNLYLYIDGARLAQALTAKSNDLTLADIARYSDMFYIGGTKNGALFGEALVIINNDLKPNFKYLMKQRGAVLAKGRLLGLQFNELFKNDLFYKLGSHANLMAGKLREIFNKYQFKEYVKNDTNQIFIIMPQKVYEAIKNKVACEIEKSLDDNTLVIRFVTSFMTKDKDIIGFDNILKEII